MFVEEMIEAYDGFSYSVKLAKIKKVAKGASRQQNFQDLFLCVDVAVAFRADTIVDEELLSCFRMI